MVDPVVTPILSVIGSSLSIATPIAIAGVITVHQVLRKSGLIKKLKARLTQSREKREFRCAVMEVINELPEELVENTDEFLENLRRVMQQMRGIPVEEETVDSRIAKVRDAYPHLVPSAPPVETQPTDGHVKPT